MTTPAEPSREQPALEPAVSTAPTPEEQPARWWSRVPHHLGRARTSTLVLAVLFLAIGALYLNVRPDPPGTVGDTGTPVTDPVPTTVAPSPPAPTSPPATSTPPPDEQPPTPEETSSTPEESDGPATPDGGEPTPTPGTTPTTVPPPTDPPTTGPPTTATPTD